MQLIKLSKPAIAILLVATLGFTACNSDKKEQEDLQKQVISTHDTLMMQMSDLMENKMSIDHILDHLDSLKQANPSLDTLLVRTDLTKIKTDLANADEQMMAWMQGFDPDYTGKSHEEVMKYLQQEKEKINSVEKSFKNVIIKSDSVISKYK